MIYIINGISKLLYFNSPNDLINVIPIPYINIKNERKL